MEISSSDKIEANLNIGMSVAKQSHCVIQPQVVPNLLDHSQKKEIGENYGSVVIGAVLGTCDAQGKIIDISNQIPMTLKVVYPDNDRNREPEYIFDTEYLKKMLKFHK